MLGLEEVEPCLEAEWIPAHAVVSPQAHSCGSGRGPTVAAPEPRAHHQTVGFSCPPGTATADTTGLLPKEGQTETKQFILLFGGRDGRRCFGDLWLGEISSKDGYDFTVHWKQVTTGSRRETRSDVGHNLEGEEGPSPRCNHSMTVHPSTGAVYLFGGKQPKGFELSVVQVQEQDAAAHVEHHHHYGAAGASPLQNAERDIYFNDLWVIDRRALLSLAGQLFPGRAGAVNTSIESVPLSTTCTSPLWKRLKPSIIPPPSYWPQPRAYHSLAVAEAPFQIEAEEEGRKQDRQLGQGLKSFLVLVGGYGLGEFVNAVDLFDCEQGNWYPQANPQSLNDNAHKKGRKTTDDDSSSDVEPTDATQQHQVCLQCGMKPPFCIHTSPAHTDYNVFNTVRCSTPPPAPEASFPARDAATVICATPTMVHHPHHTSNPSAHQQRREKEREEEDSLIAGSSVSFSVLLFGGEVAGNFFDTLLRVDMDTTRVGLLKPYPAAPAALPPPPDTDMTTPPPASNTGTAEQQQARIGSPNGRSSSCRWLVLTSRGWELSQWCDNDVSPVGSSLSLSANTNATNTNSTAQYQQQLSSSIPSSKATHTTHEDHSCSRSPPRSSSVYNSPPSPVAGGASDEEDRRTTVARSLMFEAYHDDAGTCNTPVDLKEEGGQQQPSVQVPVGHHCRTEEQKQPLHRAYHHSWPVSLSSSLAVSSPPFFEEPQHAAAASRGGINPRGTDGFFLYGGYSRSRHLGDMWYYDIPLNHWHRVHRCRQEAARKGPGLRASGSVAHFDGLCNGAEKQELSAHTSPGHDVDDTFLRAERCFSSVLFFGGDDENGTFHNDLWFCQIKEARRRAARKGRKQNSNSKLDVLDSTVGGEGCDGGLRGGRHTTPSSAEEQPRDTSHPPAPHPQTSVVRGQAEATTTPTGSCRSVPPHPHPHPHPTAFSLKSALARYILENNMLQNV